MSSPGTVVSVLFPGAHQSKRRPAVVVSTDTYQATRPDVVVALLTTNVANATGPTDYVLQDWTAAGLHRLSAFRAYFETLPATAILREIGHLSDRDWQEVQSRLRAALAVI